MYLDNETFTTVIESTPLVSIDLVVTNRQNKILLGKRVNKPAQGYWFVPGGRIQKNEQLSEAFERITLNELGNRISIHRAQLLGPFTHLYDDCVFGDITSTHYVAIAYKLIVDSDELKLPMAQQHFGYRWFDKQELLSSTDVHTHTKWYVE
ncbi:GDP-mannose mannosyl hydrolase [Vibrio alginolyticus]|nr:GDP-mannose mannosyl hydrolase [Vibrio alginolyticus]